MRSTSELDPRSLPLLDFSNSRIEEKEQTSPHARGINAHDTSGQDAISHASDCCGKCKAQAKSMGEWWSLQQQKTSVRILLLAIFVAKIIWAVVFTVRVQHDAARLNEIISRMESVIVSLKNITDSVHGLSSTVGQLQNGTFRLNTSLFDLDTRLNKTQHDLDAKLKNLSNNVADVETGIDYAKSNLSSVQKLAVDASSNVTSLSQNLVNLVCWRDSPSTPYDTNLTTTGELATFLTLDAFLLKFFSVNDSKALAAELIVGTACHFNGQSDFASCNVQFGTSINPVWIFQSGGVVNGNSAGLVMINSGAITLRKNDSISIYYQTGKSMLHLTFTIARIWYQFADCFNKTG